MLKTWPLPCTVGLVCVGGGIILTSTMTPLSATVSRKSVGVGG